MLISISGSTMACVGLTAAPTSVVEKEQELCSTEEYDVEQVKVVSRINHLLVLPRGSSQLMYWG